MEYFDGTCSPKTFAISLPDGSRAVVKLTLEEDYSVTLKITSGKVRYSSVFSCHDDPGTLLHWYTEQLLKYASSLART